MKILMLNYEYPPLGGGAGKVTQNQCLQLSKEHEVVIVTTQISNLPRFEKDQNIEIYRLNSKRKSIHKSNVIEMISWLKTAYSFCDNYLENNDIQLIFAHFSLPGGDLAFRLSKKYKIPYFVMSHGHDIPWFFPRQMFVYHLLTYFRIRNICRNAEKIIVLTPTLKKTADHFLGKEYANKIIVIPNGCDNYLHQKKEKIQNSVMKIVFVGRFVSQKNPILLIKSLFLLSQKDIPFQAEIIGDGPLFSKIKYLIDKYHLQNKVHLTGWKGSEFVQNAMNESNLFILPSRAEAMSIALLEAIFSNTFSITTPNCDNFNLIENGENGYLFETNNVVDLTDKILDFYKHFFQTNRVVNSEKNNQIQAKYNWNTIGEMYLKEIDTITKKNK